MRKFAAWGGLMRIGFRTATLVWLADPALSQTTCSAHSFESLNLGTYAGGVSTTGAGPVTVTCPSGLPFNIGLNAGAGPGATTATRVLTNGSVTLNYTLSRLPTGTNWGNLSGTDTLSSTGTGGNQSFTIYPQILGAQYPTPGTYSDTVLGTIYGTKPLITGSLSVTVSVLPACTISATNLAFGTYTGAQTRATSILSVTCTNTTIYYINMSLGANSDGTYPRMLGPGGALASYRLYQDAAYSIPWGNIYNGNGEFGQGSGGSQALTVYGQVAAGLYVQAGLYIDTVIATLTY